MQKFYKFTHPNLLFLFYISIFTKHPRQFIYSTNLFNKILIFPHSHLSHKTKTSHTATIKQWNRTHRSNNEIDDEALWWIKPINRTHWSNNEIDGEASSKTERTTKHCYGLTVKLAVKARRTVKHCGGSMEEAGLRDWRTGEKEVRVEAEKERLRWGERNK